MKVIIAKIEYYFEKKPDSRTLLPKEAETVENWKKQGWVEHLFVQSNGCAIIVFKNVDEAKARELTATLPLFSYFQGIDYTEMDKRY